jgi:8-oxo-dGTP pyrophosphatase MutT (NUDIX family)
MAAVGALLLGRRADDRARLPGAWDIFGGRVEPGEDAADALHRDLMLRSNMNPGDARV